MPGTAIGLSLGNGYPGSYSRMPDDVVKPKPLSGDTPAVFGTAAILNDDDTYKAADATLTAQNFAGIFVREVKQASDVFASQGAYYKNDPADVMLRGETVIKLARGTPKAGGTVYYRIAANEDISGSAVGDFEATADGSNTVALPNVVFSTGKVDGNNVVEIVIKTRNNN